MVVVAHATPEASACRAGSVKMVGPFAAQVAPRGMFAGCTLLGARPVTQMMTVSLVVPGPRRAMPRTVEPASGASVAAAAACCTTPQLMGVAPAPLRVGP